jgi:hypothetical protein
MSKYLQDWYNEDTGEWFTPRVRLLYTPKLLEPGVSPMFPDQEPKFDAVVLVPKEASLSGIQGALDKFAEGLYGKNWKDKDLQIKWPIKKTAAFDRVAEHAEDYPHRMGFSSFKDKPPTLIASNATLYKGDGGDFYAGRWVRIATKIRGPKPEKKDVNRYLSLDLCRIQLLDEADRLSTGRIATAVGFEPATFSSGASADAVWDPAA